MSDMTDNSANIVDFDDMPMCIHKDHYKNRIRTPLISLNNNAVRPNRKLILGSLERKSHTENVFSPYHFHEGIEILRITMGNCTVVINETVYEAHENDILVVNPFESHGIYLADTQAEFQRTCLIFNPSDLFPPRKKSNMPLFDMLSGAGFTNYVSGKAHFSNELCTSIDRITELAELRPTGWQVAILGQLVMFYSAMLREQLKKGGSGSVPYQMEFMSVVSDYVEDNFSREITTAQVAEHCLYSVEHFCRLFKKCFNRTFKEYLSICRIQRARDLIDTGRVKTVGEVSRSVGFKNANHFCNTFKKSVGMTPSEYINMRGKNYEV